MNGEWGLFIYRFSYEVGTVIMQIVPMRANPRDPKWHPLCASVSHEQVYVGTWDECVALGKMTTPEVHWWDDDAPIGWKWKYVWGSDER